MEEQLKAKWRLYRIRWNRLSLLHISTSSKLFNTKLIFEIILKFDIRWISKSITLMKESKIWCWRLRQLKQEWLTSLTNKRRRWRPLLSGYWTKSRVKWTKSLKSSWNSLRNFHNNIGWIWIWTMISIGLNQFWIFKVNCNPERRLPTKTCQGRLQPDDLVALQVAILIQ